MKIYSCENFNLLGYTEIRYKSTKGLLIHNQESSISSQYSFTNPVLWQLCWKWFNIFYLWICGLIAASVAASYIQIIVPLITYVQIPIGTNISVRKFIGLLAQGGFLQTLWFPPPFLNWRNCITSLTLTTWSAVV